MLRGQICLCRYIKHARVHFFIYWYLFMSRAQRILYENAYYHVMNRGAGRREIFHDRIDREIFLQTIGEACKQFCIEIHAYCLMGNHYHLLMKTPEANLSRVMRHINGVYTQRYNRLKKTDGPLFRGRYKAILVDSDAYLLHLSKYIHLNPLSAGIVDCLAEYEWSSYSAYIDRVKAPTWLVRDEIYGQLTGSEQKAEHYRSFIANEDLDKTLIKFYSQTSAAPILGDEAFVSTLTLAKPSMEVSRKVRVMKRLSIFEIISEVASMFSEEKTALITIKKGRGKSNVPRKMAMYIASKYGDYRLQEIADVFGLRHYGGVSSTVHLFMKELQHDPDLREKVSCVLKKLRAQI